MKISCLPIVLGFLLCGAWAQAQSYAIDRSVIAAGGGTSTGGAYSLSGTIGQADAGPQLAGGNFTLEGGFWPGLILPATGETPALLIQLAGADVRITWTPATAGFVLQQTDSLTAPAWSTAPAGNPLVVAPDGTTRFYRLSKQP